tara:strand:- start:14641 stop:15438 length:798 start_codon:yes stop_codon:yes gene_type:complete
MKLDIMTFSVNEKDEYVRYWEPLSQHIKQYLNLHPVLLYVGKEDLSLSEEYGDVHRIYCGDDIPTYIPSTWGWFWIASQYPDKTCMQSGIDMVVMNKYYFDQKIKDLDDDCYVVSNADGYTSPEDLDYWKQPYNTFPSYYHIAKGKIFKEALDLMDDFKEEVEKINKIDYSDKGRGYSDNPSPFLTETCVKNNGKWCLDELHSTELLRNYSNQGGKVITHSMSKASRLTIPSNAVVNNTVPSGLDDFHFGKPYPSQEEIKRFLRL